MPAYGGGRIIFNERPLKYGSELNNLNIPNAVLLHAKDYYLVVKGYKAFDSATSKLPGSISSLLSSWNIDIAKKDPQYINNPHFKLEQSLSNGKTMMRNVITVTIKKAFVHNNVRLVLYGSSTPSQDPLFWVDLDEDNK
jgi:hypothetical protein